MRPGDWIPVSDRMPTKHDEYIVFIPIEGHPPMVKVSAWGPLHAWSEEIGWCSLPLVWRDKVTHWAEIVPPIEPADLDPGFVIGDRG